METHNAAIAVQGLTRRFGETVAVNDLHLLVQSGEVLGFLGHNGAGKTTTVRLLNGVLHPSSGSARVLGLDPVSDGPALRRRTGVLTETPSLDERLSGRENLAYYAELYSVPQAEARHRVEELLAAFGLADRADDKVGGYSKGMKQRLALSRAILHRPEILFLDEPTAGLDPVASRAVHDLVAHLSREEGATVFLCTHNLAEAQKLCHRVAVLERGRLLALGTPAQLVRQMGQSLRLELDVAPGDAPRAQEALKAAGVAGVAPEEGNLLLVQGVQREMIPALLVRLVGAGVRVYRVAPQEPTLEDVYFALQSPEEVPA
ncbi:MAG: ABC transporter ATP-binding protein [Chloroflexi bacterium]|nr:ABC transporter ATP-binding protein [Chloroflexota bacterium]